MMKKLLSLSLIFILSFGSFTGCKKDKGAPPILPGPESMTIDFSNFSALKKSSGLQSGQKGTENSNWDYSATVVVTWKLLIAVKLAVPVASFKEAAGQVPVFISDKNWQWSYDFTLANVTYKARLTGLIGSNNVTWKMYITQEGTGGFSEFLWFEGTSKADGTSGQWIFYENSQTQVPILQIDWTKNGDSIASIKYTYVKNLDPFKTSYIEYGLTTSDLNAFFNIHYYTGLKFSDVNIEWNSTTKNGRVKSLDYLGDTDWHCWDSNKINIICK
jgi:hypothetical protein